MKMPTFVNGLRALVICAAVWQGASASQAAARRDATTEDPQLNVAGVGLGTMLPVVKTALGPPDQEIDEPHDPNTEMGMGAGKALRYDGLRIEVCKPPGKKEFHVWRMVVSAPARKLAAGIRVGMTREQAIKTMGSPESISRDEHGAEVLHYAFRRFDGWYWITIKNGVVAEIGMAEDWS